MPKEIVQDDFSIKFNETESTVTFSGTLRLQNLAAYDSVKILLKEAREAATDRMTLNFKDLVFLNSSGITAISMFLIDARKKSGAGIRAVGSVKIPWQEKAMGNFKKLWNELELTLE